jgi:hypothetical protein
MKRYILLAVAAFAWAPSLASAQDTLRGPDGGTSTHVSGVVVLSIPGKPFSAKTTTEWTQTLADGSTINKHLDAYMARDSQGRIYRENHTFVPSGSGQKSPLNSIHLTDPVAHAQMYCYPKLFKCIVTNYTPQTFFQTQQTGPFDHGNRFLARESLGPKTIEGIYVSGTRETTTVNPGILGNDQPLVSTREFWYSDELQTNLAVTRNDPREGKQVIQLSEISQAEPDAHMFQVPLGYSVRDDRSPAGNGTVITRKPK